MSRHPAIFVMLLCANVRGEPPHFLTLPPPTACMAGETVQLEAAASQGVIEWRHLGHLRETGPTLALPGIPQNTGRWVATVRSEFGANEALPAMLSVQWPSPAPGVVDGDFIGPGGQWDCLAVQGTRVLAGGDAGLLLLEDGVVRLRVLQPAIHSVAALADGTWAAGYSGGVFFLNDGGITRTVARPGEVHALLPVSSGRLLAGGSALARLLPDGSVDGTFSPPPLNGPIYAITDAGAGRVLIGGAFTGTANRIARLLENGALDTTFAAGLSGASGEVFTIARQQAAPALGLPEPRWVVGGAFLRMHGQLRQRIARLREDGALDSSFRADADAPVRAVLPEAPGGIVVAGDFEFLRGRSCSGLARLAPNGTGGVAFESSFRPPALDAGVKAVALQGTGGFIAAGNFTRPRGGLMRVWSTTPPQEPAKIMALEETADAVAGGPVLILPTVRGYPAPAVRWLHNGQTRTGLKLQIDSITPADSGAWTLEAENAHGRDARTFTLNVRPAPWPGESAVRAWTWTGPLAITDTGTVEAPIAVAENFPVHRLRAAVQLTHVETGDLTVTLIAPGGAEAVLLRPQRRIGWDLQGTVFDDAAAMQLSETADPHPGAHRPAESLAIFAGESTAGTWRLRINDPLPDGVSGNLLSWRLEVMSAPVAQTFDHWQAANPEAPASEAFKRYALGGFEIVAGAIPGLLLERPAAADAVWEFESTTSLDGPWEPFAPGSPAWWRRDATGRETVRYQLPLSPAAGERRFYRVKARKL